MSRFPLTVPTASNGALLAHSRKVIVSLKIYHRTQSEYTSLNQDQDIFSSQVCLFMTRHTVAGTVILKKKKRRRRYHTHFWQPDFSLLPTGNNASILQREVLAS